MPGRIRLKVVKGPMRGETFIFDKPGTFVFGRLVECDIPLPHDVRISRHHFILAVDPPEARIRDLGSLNGTYVNGIKYGGRPTAAPPKKGDSPQHREVDLEDKDQIELGETVIEMKVEVGAVCCECGGEIPASDREQSAWVGGTFLCTHCRGGLAGETRKIIALAAQEAKDLGHKHIGAEHVLLGLLRDEENPAAQVLLKHGLKLEEIRAEVLSLLRAGSAEADVAQAAAPPPGSPPGEARRPSAVPPPASSGSVTQPLRPAQAGHEAPDGEAGSGQKGGD